MFLGLVGQNRLFLITENFRRPRLYSILTAYAGPFSNFVLALVAFCFLKMIPFEFLPIKVSFFLSHLFVLIAQVSVMLGVFNLLPIPPLDGSHILMVLLMGRYPRVLVWLYRYSLFILIALFVLVPQFLYFLWFAIETVYNFLHSLVF